MKLIKSRIPHTTVKVEVLLSRGREMGGFVVRFDNYKAVVPDAVATSLVGMNAAFYTVVGSVGDACQNAKVLVVRDSGLGDVLLTTPLIRKLHMEKGATVDVLTSDANRTLFIDNPHVRETFALETFGGDKEALLFADYDIVLDLRLVVENAEFAGINEHRADAFAAYADFTLTEAERRPDLFLSDDEKQKAERYRRVFMEGGRIGVVGYVWSSSTSNRNWSNATHDAVISGIEAAGYGVLLLGEKWNGIGNRLPSCASGEDSHVVDLMGFTDVREAAAILSHCDSVITPDTGAFHLAAALDVPTLTYFGAFPVDERAAHKSLVVLNDASVCGLSPCRQYRCFNRDENGQARCLSVSPDGVVARLQEMLPVKPTGPAVVELEPSGDVPVAEAATKPVRRR